MRLLTNQEMLSLLDDDGVNAASDFDDREQVMGWFGWRVDTDNQTLTVTYAPRNDDGTSGQLQQSTWLLDLVEDE